MTSPAARHLAYDDSGDPEPSGLASQWADDAPPRRAAAEQAPQFQSTPLRVDEAFGEYEPYRAAPELQPFDAVAAAPALSAPREGWGAEPVVALAPEPQPVTYGWTPPVAPMQMPMPTAPVLYPTVPVPYPTVPAYQVAPYPSVPGTTTPYAPAPPMSGPVPADPYAHVPYPNGSSSAYGPNPYTAMVQPSQTDSDVTAAAVAIGGSVWAMKHLVFAIPLIVGLLIFTIGSLSLGGRFGTVLVAFAWITAIPGIVKVVVKGPQSWARLRSRRF